MLEDESSKIDLPGVLTSDDLAEMNRLRGYDDDLYRVSVTETVPLLGAGGVGSNSPQWLQLLHSVLDGRKQKRDAVGETCTDDGFGRLLTPFADYATDKLGACLERMDFIGDAAAVLDEVRDALLERLVEMSLKTEVLEMNRERVSGSLNGDTSAERQESFFDLLSQPGYRQSFSPSILPSPDL